MKSLVRLAAVTFILIGLSTSAHAAKKKPTDFSEFKGTYTGSLVLTYGTQTIPGTATISVSVPKSGASAVVNITGSISSGGITYPLSNTFAFAKNKTVSQSQILYGIDASGYPSSGTYTGKKALSFTILTAVNSVTAVTQGSLSVKPQGKKHRRLLLTTTLSATGSPTAYIFTFDAIAKVKAPKK